MNEICKCGAEICAPKKTVQIFSNGTKHIRVECETCGKFLGYEKQNGEVSMRWVPVKSERQARFFLSRGYDGFRFDSSDTRERTLAANDDDVWNGDLTVFDDGGGSSFPEMWDANNPPEMFVGKI